MKAHSVFGALVSICLLASISLSNAKEVRDGSSFERAILVPGDYEHSGAWEWDYLKRRFGGRGMPKEHAFMEHNGRWYDQFVFGTAAGDKIVYFDVTRFASRIFKKRTKSLAEIMKEAGIEPK